MFNNLSSVLYTDSFSSAQFDLVLDDIAEANLWHDHDAEAEALDLVRGF
jgi:hypothetical protein